MAAAKPNVVILRSHLDTLRERVAAAGLTAPEEVSIDDTRVRLCFASGTDAEVMKFLATIPHEAFGHIGVMATPELAMQMQEARKVGPDAVKALMDSLERKARSQT